jgi:hypothetical protein
VGECGWDERLGVDRPEDLEYELRLRLGLGRTQPAESRADDIASEGVLLERECFRGSVGDDFFRL